MIISLIESVRRATRSLAGPIVFAGSNFFVAILLQRSVDARQFGFYAFCQVVVAAGLGISNGLLGNPLTVLLARSPNGKREIIGSFFRGSLVYSLLGLVLSLGLMRLAGAGGLSLLLMGLLTSISWLRWFVRSMELALQRRSAASQMDVFFGAISIGGVLAVRLLRPVDLDDVLTILILASLISPMGSVVQLRQMCVDGWRGSWRIFIESLSTHGGWAAFSNMATQVSVNSHAYLITLMVGAAAFAPVALATILFRPLGVVLTGLIQYEQPRMADHIGCHDWRGLRGDVAFVRNLVALAWLGNSAIVALLLIKFPAQISRDNVYDLRTLVMATALVSAITLLRSLREPMSAVLQAAGRFRELAKIAAICCPVPMVLSWALLLAWPSHVSLSLLGALLGEIANLILVYGYYTRFKMTAPQVSMA